MTKRLLNLDDDILELEAFDDMEQALKDRVHQRLSERCEVDHATGCWIYTGAWGEDGQGKVRVGYKVYPVSRVAAWLYLKGFRLWDVPLVLHKRWCPHPACFNPDHLVIVDDLAKRLAHQRRCGRLGRCVRRLSPAKVRQAREWADGGVAVDEIHRRINGMLREPISLGSLKRALSGLTWRGV